MKYRLIAAALVLSLPGLSQTASAQTFNDVNSNTTYSDSIYWTVNQGITSGYDDGSGNWGPEICVKRAELLKMMVQYKLGDFEGAASGLTGDDGFSDVNPSNWFYDYVRYAKDLGIVEGYSDGTFRPENCVNRVEAMKVAVSTLMPGEEIDTAAPLKYWGQDRGPLMVDMDSNAWYAPYARVLFNSGLVGTNHTQKANVNNTFSQDYLNFFPDKDMARKEVAYMMHQIDKYLKIDPPTPAPKPTPTPKPTPKPEPKEDRYEWTEYDLSFDIPEGYYVYESNDDNTLVIDDRSSLSEDEIDDPLEDISYLKFEKGAKDVGSFFYQDDVSILFDDVATRGFYAMTTGDGWTEYLLQVRDGVLIYHMGEETENTTYPRNRILSSLVVANSDLKEVSELPEETDYYNFGNGHVNENLTLHDDILSIEVNYPNGCDEAHDFELLWEGEADNPNNPQKVYLVDLFLDHDDKNETCDEPFNDRFDFDISNINEELEEGKITLRVHGGGNGTQYIDYEI